MQLRLIAYGIVMNSGVIAATKICGSQAIVAKACDVSQPTVFKWRSGANMDVKYIPPILQATNFEVNPTELRPDVDWQTIYDGLRKVFEKKAKAL
ncbi:YdaS family helix-turn-helix protein [Rodentibacter pneumotropicus]|uniref:YdaS family helix-turn-helix protein n=1 Tax=Rodentibacter pneumotropicus TaxID=758 RepID=UPI00277B4903|nr:YdaS family helix-turn-helix protein [Rodentibacter pneumotropicus]